jgi:hypothetical protein
MAGSAAVNSYHLLRGYLMNHDLLRVFRRNWPASEGSKHEPGYFLLSGIDLLGVSRVGIDG